MVASLTIDGSIIKSGTKAIFNIHSATGSDLTVRFLDGQGIDIKLGLPIEKQEIVNFKSEMVSIFAERGQPDSENKIKFNVERYRLVFFPS